MRDYVLVHLLIGKLEDLPYCGLATSGWPHDDHAHPLPSGFIELEDLLYLSLNLHELHLLQGFLDGLC